MKDKHRPTPWKVVSLSDDNFAIHDATGIIATISGRFTDGKRCDAANTALIVRAVNRDHLFDELIEALQNCRSLVKLKFGNTDPTANTAIAQADAVLEKVRAAQ